MAGVGEGMEIEVEVCSRIHLALETLSLNVDLQASIPSDGLYFFYEEGEVNGHTGRPRIVRVGNHPRRSGGLRSRLRNHYSGSKNGSVFRRYLGGAILRRSDPNHPCLQPGPGQGHWEKQDAKPCEICQPIEKAVSDLLRTRFRFRCVAIPERSTRNRFEEGIIAALCRCPYCKPSSSWLGHDAYSPDVRSSGLWNANFVRAGRPLKLSELEQFEDYVRLTKVA